ncbi:MAG: hypothetical protein HW398_1145 [Acidobacteria bacterium]|nr:hypothetical protein [Acidobacteriota bacterium]
MDVWCLAFTRCMGDSLSSLFGPSHRGGPHYPKPSATMASADFSLRSFLERLPFGSEGRSPQVRLLGCPCTSAGSTWPPLGRESFAVLRSLALVGPASYPVPVRRPAGLALRCFQRFPHGYRLAVRSGRCDHLPKGLSPPSRVSCWAHEAAGSLRSPAAFFMIAPLQNCGRYADHRPL